MSGLTKLDLEAREITEGYKCPPHHFVISDGVGRCKYCPETKDFGELLKKQHGF